MRSDIVNERQNKIEHFQLDLELHVFDDDPYIMSSTGVVGPLASASSVEWLAPARDRFLFD